MHRRWKLIIASLAAISAPMAAADGHDPGATAWIMTTTALVLFMTIPGLSLFYAGARTSEERTQHIDAVLLHHMSRHHSCGCFSVTAWRSVMATSSSVVYRRHSSVVSPRIRCPDPSPSRVSQHFN